VHPDPDRLFELADELINGHKSETDIRRAIATAYYGVFHFILRQVADTIAGSGNHKTNLYNMVYRSVQHKPLRDLCNQFRGTTLGPNVKPYSPLDGFGPIVAFAGLIYELYEQRILADYVPFRAFEEGKSRITVGYGREAVKHFKEAKLEQRAAFIALLTIKPKQIDREE
jgi:hypothetical protein